MAPTSPVTVTARLQQSRWSKRTTPESECRCTHARLRLRASEHLALLPTVALVMLPKCPLCLAAWFGIFSYLAASPWFRVAWSLRMIGLLSLTIVALALRARRTHNLRPLLVSLLGASAVVCRYSLMDVPLLLYAGLGLLVSASLWSSLLKASS